MKDTIIVSGGNIHKDFALDFLKKNKTEQTCLIAADRGVEFFMGTDMEPNLRRVRNIWKLSNIRKFAD